MDNWGYQMVNSTLLAAEMAAIGMGLDKDTFTKKMHQGPHLLAPTASDLQKFEKHASNLIDQLRKTFTFKEGGFPGVMIFNYEGEASLESIKLN